MVFEDLKKFMLRSGAGINADTAKIVQASKKIIFDTLTRVRGSVGEFGRLRSSTDKSSANTINLMLPDFL